MGADPQDCMQYKKLTEYTVFEVGAITLDPGPGIPDLVDVLWEKTGEWEPRWWVDEWDDLGNTR